MLSPKVMLMKLVALFLVSCLFVFILLYYNIISIRQGSVAVATKVFQELLDLNYPWQGSIYFLCFLHALGWMKSEYSTILLASYVSYLFPCIHLSAQFVNLLTSFFSTICLQLFLLFCLTLEDIHSA